VAVILAIGIAFRVREALRTPLWFDELFTLWLSRLPLPQMWTMLGGDIHPPLPTLMVSAWRMIGGEHTLWLKMLPLSIGVLTLLAAYGLTRDLFGRGVAAVGALLLALHPMHIYFSQELRSYGLLTLALVLSAWTAWRWTVSSRRRDAILWACAMALTMHTHYLGAVVLAFLDLWVLAVIVRDRSRWRDWLLVQAGALVLCLPLAAMLPHQMQLSRDHWIPPPHIESIVDFVRKLAFGAYYWIPVVFLVAAFAWRRQEARRGATLLAWLLIVPVTVAVLLTLRGQHLFSERHWFIVVPFACVLMAAGIAALPSPAVRIVTALVFVLFAARASMLFRPHNEAVALREVAVTLASRMAPDDLLFCVDHHSLITLDHHLGNTRGVLMTKVGVLPYHVGGAIVPAPRYVKPDSLVRAASAGRRWWAVRTRESGLSTEPIAAMIDSLARGERRHRDPVTMWASQPGMMGEPR
jgi:uncharacterized membrane protein